MFNFRKKETEFPAIPANKVFRTRVIEGISVPAIIHNSSYFFVDLTVYEDGTVECWELTDLELFKNKLEKGWVKTYIPDGKSISVHGLGSWKIDRGDWLFDKQTFFEYVSSIIKKLNPQMQNLYRVYEKRVNGVRVLESGKGTIYKEQKRFDRDYFPQRINGDGFNLFFKQEDKFFLANLVVFPDEKVQLHRIPEIVEFNLQELKDQVEKGTVLTEIPENTTVEIYGLGNFKILNPDYPCTSIQDKLLEIRDLIEKQNNRPDSVDLCRSVFKDYLINPTVKLREKLKIAYENIPDHQRMYVGDMDTKDIAVRMIIYGGEEIKNWSHYIASELLEEELPTINVPKPKDE